MSRSIRILFLMPLILLLTDDLISQPAWQKTFCNPIDISYRYSWNKLDDSLSYRSGADPVIILHDGEYYLFVTNSGGYWHSDDLLHWNHIEPNRWPLEDMTAPTALSVKDTLFLFQSTFERRPIFYSTEPRSGKLEFYNRWMPKMPGAEGPWDPALYFDEDTGRWFMYFGSSNLYPLYVIELDPSRDLTYIGSAKPLLYLYPEKHGWERFGPNHTHDLAPYIEGAWMTKYGEKYYLQYAAPGTEYNVYSNGTYVGDDPMGPFEYAPYNPVSYKPGGCWTGAGHGNTFQDLYGNFWNTGTPWIAVNWKFERRIAMFPAGFDQDGQMYSNTRFGDFPHHLPTGKMKDRNELFTGWMLLSYKKACTASSVRDTFSTSRVTDENPRTFWVPVTNNAGEWITVDLGQPCEVRAFQLNYADHRSNRYVHDASVYLQYRMFYSADGISWELMHDQSGTKEDHPNAYVELPQPVNARYVKFENRYVPTPNVAISDIRIFGKSPGKQPAVPRGLKAVRHTDGRNCTITWKPVKGAVGYNILWGIDPSKLYQTYQFWADEGNSLELRALTVDQEYWFAIEAFNEAGVSEVSEIVGVME